MQEEKISTTAIYPFNIEKKLIYVTNFDANGNIISKKNLDKKNKVTSSETYEYNSKGFVTKIIYASKTDDKEYAVQEIEYN